MKQLMNKSTIKKVTAVLLCMVVFVSFAAAADEFGLDSKISTILNLLSSPWIKGICCIALIAECIGLITAGRQEPGMFKKFIPWIAGTVLFMAAGTITSKFVNVQTTTFTDTLKITE